MMARGTGEVDCVCVSLAGWESQIHPRCPHSWESTLAVRGLLWERRQPLLGMSEGLSEGTSSQAYPDMISSKVRGTQHRGSLVHVPARCLLTAGDLGHH